jgi:DNA repair exonuclease SbcCD ATPase subunit
MSNNDNSTSTTDSETQPVVQPETGTPIPAGETPGNLEDALKALEKLARHAENKNEQATRHATALAEARKKLEAYEKQEREAQLAAMSEQERLQTRATEAEQRLKDTHQRYETSLIELAAQKKGIIDTNVAALLIRAEGGLETGADGLPSNLDQKLEELVKARPYLLAQQPVATPPQTQEQPQQQQQAPSVPPFNPGRSSLADPETQLPFRPPTLAEVFKNRR